MKKFFTIFAGLAAAIAFASCIPEAAPGTYDEVGKYTPGVKRHTLSTTPGSIEFTADGGSKSLTMNASAYWTSEIRQEGSWLRMNRTSASGGKTVLSVTAAANSSSQARSADITFKITQMDSEPVTYIVSVKQAAGSGSNPPVDPPTPPVDPPVDPPVVVITATVTTGSATAISNTSATVAGSFDGANTTIYDRGFFWGTSASALTQQAGLSSTTGTSGSFSAVLSSLQPSTTYWYQAYLTVLNPNTNTYVDVKGSVLSFTTTGSVTPPTPGPSGLQYLGCYEMPAIALANTSAASGSGNETYGNTKWYNYNTTNSNQMVVTHTYPYGGKTWRNYTCLVDKTKKAPLWSAFVMHNSAYPDNGVGRTGNWHDDPGIPSGWQQESSGSGYSRGHFVASNYRQTTDDANKQTFYNTNQALQEQNGFNGAVWNTLENAVKGYAPTGRDTLYVVVGVLYEDNYTIGGVPVPSHFYKLLMYCSFNTSGTMTAAKGSAYLFTNVSHSGMKYSEALTTIDAVEERSGFNFFANVPSELQEAAERTSDSKMP